MTWKRKDITTLKFNDEKASKYVYEYSKKLLDSVDMRYTNSKCRLVMAKYAKCKISTAFGQYLKDLEQRLDRNKNDVYCSLFVIASWQLGLYEYYQDIMGMESYDASKTVKKHIPLNAFRCAPTDLLKLPKSSWKVQTINLHMFYDLTRDASE